MSATPIAESHAPGHFQLMPDETALVTGAATNIGRATARLLAREGVRVALSDINAERGAAVVAELRAEGLDTSFIQADLSNPAEAARLGQAAIERLGSVSLFVHSASPIRSERDTVFEVSEETFDRMLNVNVKSGFILGRDLGRHMKERSIRGRMVYVTSLHAGTPRYLPHYSASKAAESMIMKELAKALGPHGIRVNAVAPGSVKGGTVQLSGQQEDAWAGKIPMRRTGRQDEVAQMILALVVDRFSSYVTGTTVVVDGGLELYNWKNDLI